MVETVSSTSQLVEMGALKAQPVLRPRPGARAALGVDDWLVGVAAAADGSSAPAGHGGSPSQKVAVPASDWGRPKPRPGPDLPSFAAVVPAQEVTGGIKLAGYGSQVVGEIVIAPNRAVANTLAQATEGTAWTRRRPSRTAARPAAEGLLSGSARESLTTTLEQEPPRRRAGRSSAVVDGGELVSTQSLTSQDREAPVPFDRRGRAGRQKASFDEIEEFFFQQEEAFVSATPAPVESFSISTTAATPRQAGRAFGSALLAALPRRRPR